MPLLRIDLSEVHPQIVVFTQCNDRNYYQRGLLEACVGLLPSPLLLSLFVMGLKPPTGLLGPIRFCGMAKTEAKGPKETIIKAQ